MNRSWLPSFGWLGVALLIVGCASKPQQAGFLSDYSKLEPVSSTRLRYIGPAVKQYDKFIIDPVTTVFYDPEQAKGVKAKDIQHLEQHLYGVIYKTLAERYTIVAEPGPGVARLRFAITNLKASTPALNVLPQTKLTGMGLGQASAEMELVDSVTGKQLAAAIDSETGSRFSFSGLSKWGDVEAVMNDWAKRLGQRLDEAHAPPPAQ